MISRTPGRRIGLLTIGGAPRHDSLAREVRDILGPDLDVVERGGLDGLSTEQVAALRVCSDQGTPLATQMADGRSVIVDEAAITPLLSQQISRLERQDQVEATLLMCTGSFPQLEHKRPLFQPHAALYRTVVGMAGAGQLSALTPLEAQVEHARNNWLCTGVTRVELLVVDPYGPDPLGAVSAAAATASAAGSQLLYLDCFGYDRAMKQAAQRAFGGPVVLARSLAARLLAEIVT
jgi:protein AroM